MTGRRVVVVGGGLAGISAALRCREKGFEVSLVEAKPRLGGATSSFYRGEFAIDTGQHVVLRCYTEYADLLRRLGVQDALHQQPRFRVPVVAPGGRSWVLQRGRLPAPAHFLPVLLGHRALTASQRVQAAQTAMALRQLDPEDPALDRISFGAWLQARGESARTVQVLWGLFAVAALNAQPDQASLALAVRVFRSGVLDRTDAGDIAIPLRPLGELHGTAAHQSLVAAGVRVVPRTKARTIRREVAEFRVTVSDGDLVADAVVIAVPHHAAEELVAALPLSQAVEWSQLGAVPIVNLHVIYDRKVTELPMAAAIDSPVQWVFDHTQVGGVRRGQYLAVSLSDARHHMHARSHVLRESFVPALGELFPRAHQAAVLDFFVTREPRATFLQSPGTRRVRPAARTAIPGLVLAGAWTDTGWPDTIEGAVISGNRAAEVVASTSRTEHCEAWR